MVDDNLRNAASLEKLLSPSARKSTPPTMDSTPSRWPATTSPTSILLDIGLPVMDGYEVARRLPAEIPSSQRITLVAMTGYGKDEDRRRSQEAGFNAHLVKPVNLEDLEAPAAEHTDEHKCGSATRIQAVALEPRAASGSLPQLHPSPTAGFRIPPACRRTARSTDDGWFESPTWLAMCRR